MPQFVFVLNKDTNLLEVADKVMCEVCHGKVVSGNVRHRRRVQLANSKNWTRLRPMCRKCDGHGYVIQSTDWWRRMYKKEDASYRVGELPEEQSVAGSSKAMLAAKKAFENYEEPKELKVFLTERLRRAKVDYNKVLHEVEKALVYRALKKHPTNITKAAEYIGMNRTTFVKILKELTDGA